MSRVPTPPITDAGSDASAATARVDPPASLSFLSYGVRFSVEVGATDLGERIWHHLPPGAEIRQDGAPDRIYSFEPHRADAGSGPRYTVFVDRKPLICGVAATSALRAFEADLQIHVAEMSPSFVFVHAGVVGWQGEAILLPGRSYSGKSTLVAALVQLGAEYYSDEYAALDAAGGVHPYARPLSIRQDDGRSVLRISAGELGGCDVQVPLPVGLVVMSRYTSEGHWQPRRLSPGQAALALLENTVPARRRPEAVIGTLRHVVSRAGLFISERGEASGVAARIMELATRP